MALLLNLHQELVEKLETQINLERDFITKLDSFLHFERRLRLEEERRKAMAELDAKPTPGDEKY